MYKKNINLQLINNSLQIMTDVCFTGCTLKYDFAIFAPFNKYGGVAQMVRAQDS